MSQQVTKEKYSIETLRERNVSYDHQHWLTQEDVDMANSYVELIITETPLLTAGVQKKDIFPYANSRMCLSCGKRTAISV